MLSNAARTLKKLHHARQPVLFFLRHESTARHFYQNRQLELYAAKEAQRLTLRQLVFYGRHMNEERLIKSANYVRTELPVRIAHRLRDLQTLPYVVVTQESVAKVYELYWSAFEKFRRYPPITTLSENEKFCEFVGGLLNEHATVIPNLSLGLSLSSPYLAPDELDSVMRRMLISRISRRVLAEHHIALTEIFMGHREKEAAGEPHVGIIFTGLKVKKSIERCVKLLRQRPTWVEVFEGEDIHICHWPEVIIDGQLDTQFPYIKEHLEYIVFELLKNVSKASIPSEQMNSYLCIQSMRATLIAHKDSSYLPPIQITIAAGENNVGIRISDQGGGLFTSECQIKEPADLFSFSHLRNATRMENSRIGALRSASASEEGVRATVDEQVYRWNHTKTQEMHFSDVGIETRPRIGIGLPMSNIFTTYFGGSLELVSLDGWGTKCPPSDHPETDMRAGTDAYLRLPKLGTNLEGIEV
ncbi:[3-methyl-2-oxobutanoate dehydrogenase [lipoamide]] kinase, mitochondrial [Leucoagaricus sp. SymC.cos]|nr:[3-methyl-2-oxobutanoate dehydrogenase [lipoamide]] kinase, mitochondrial [Leucoagaricus sp. SymC.cos]